MNSLGQKVVRIKHKELNALLKLIQAYPNMQSYTAPKKTNGQWGSNVRI